jgi:hypothetical protein
MQRAAIWEVSPHVRTTHLEDGTAIMLDIKNGVFCKLNAAGSCIWQTIASSAGGAALEGIVTALQSQNAKVLFERLELDAIKYLEKLEQMELVHRTHILTRRASHLKKKM